MNRDEFIRRAVIELMGRSDVLAVERIEVAKAQWASLEMAGLCGGTAVCPHCGTDLVEFKSGYFRCDGGC